MGGLKPAPNTFESLSSFTDPNSPYLQGVLGQVGGLVLFGILLFLLFGIALVITRLCCRSDKPSTGWCCCCRRVSYCTLSLLASGCVGVALFLFSTWRTGLSDTIGSLRAFSGVLSSASATVNGLAAGPLTALVSDAGALRGTCQTQNCDGLAPGLQAAVNALSSQASSTKDSVDSLGSSLASSSAEFLRDLGLASDSKFNLDQIKNSVDLGGWVVLGVLAGWLLLHLSTLSPTKTSACMFRFSTVCTLLASSAVAVLAALFYGVALVGSDVCVAPSAGISRLLNSTSSSNALAANTFAYYASCTDGGAPSTGFDAAAQVAAAGSALGNAAAQVALLNATVLAGVQPINATLANILFNSLGAITFDLAACNASVVSLATTTLACGNVNSIYNALLNALCGKAIDGAAQTFVPVVVASALLFFLLCYALALCAHHPGDHSDYEEKEALIVGAAWGNDGSFVPSPSNKSKGAAQEWGAGSKKNPSYGSVSRYERRGY